MGINNLCGIKDFCGTKNSESSRVEPFVIDGYEWATNGHWLARHKVKAKKSKGTFPDVWAVWEERTAFQRTPLTLPITETLYEKRPCETCGYSGRMNTEVCPTCHGEAEAYCQVAIPILWPGTASLSSVYVTMLRNRRFRIYPRRSKKLNKPVYFSNGTFEGLLMPIDPNANHLPKYVVREPSDV